jgi:NADPH:quinone reductase-like Zn-dependent oxidoreductase
VQFKKGETVVVSGAAGGVGSLAVQLARRTGAGLLADGHLELPIANVYPLTQVREAYAELERRHTHGKIVLRP